MQLLIDPAIKGMQLLSSVQLHMGFNFYSHRYDLAGLEPAIFGSEDQRLIH
jgi:hypothetical protein